MGTRAMSGCVFDVDFDGDEDLLCPGYSDNPKGWRSAVYLNLGDDTFKLDTNIFEKFGGGGTFFPGDFNNDGFMDYIVNGYNIEGDNADTRPLV